MNKTQLKHIFHKTKGHCHFCGDAVVFERRGWSSSGLAGYWEVDHVIQRGKGGASEASNCLPACTKCNRLRWHRKGAQVRELLLFGLIAKDEIKRKTKLGNLLMTILKKRVTNNSRRRQLTVSISRVK